MLARNFLTLTQAQPLNSYKSVVLVCHSMGGLVAQWAVLHGAFRTSLGLLALYGTPSTGIMKARAGKLLKRQIADMVTGSPFIKRLRQQWSERFVEPPFKLLAIAGDCDDFVPPESVFADFNEKAKHVVQGDHASMLDVKTMSDLAYGLVVEGLLGRPHVRTVHDAASVALELGDYRAVVDQLLPHCDTLDESALIQLALAQDGLGRSSEALALLEKHGERLDESDALSVLGGRLKRSWLATRNEGVFQRARAKYDQALKRAQQRIDNSQIYYAAINLAFLDLVHTPPNTALPETVEQNARLAQQAAYECPPGRWRDATLGESSLILGDMDPAFNFYRAALESRPSAREIDSLYQHLVRIIEVKYPDDKIVEPLMSLFKTNLLTPRE